MKETIYLAVSRRGVSRMTKRLPDLNRGEIPVKVIVTIEEKAFREPVLERSITVTDWRDGIELGDLDLREGIITEQEAGVIRAQRLARMAETLSSHGYKVEEPAPAGDGLDPARPAGYSDTMPG